MQTTPTTQPTTVRPVGPGSPWFAPAVGLLAALEVEQVGDAAEPLSAGYLAVSWSTPGYRRAAWVALVDEEVVGTAVVALPRRDNTHLVEVELVVRPDHRGRGHGRALLEQVRRYAQQEDRGTLLLSTGRRPSPEQVWRLHEQVVADPGSSSSVDPGTVPGVSFLRAAGAAVVQSEVRSQVAVPVRADRLAAVREEAAPRATGYRVVTWTHRPPQDLLADKARLNERMSTDPPLGDLDWRAEVWDADRVLEQATSVRERGLDVVGAGALDPEGRLVAFSEMARDTRHPERAHQQDTIVDPDHRGRRLGMVVKAANLAALAAFAPEVRVVQTWNALENGPMLRVNRALGFEPVGLYSAWQLRLE